MKLSTGLRQTEEIKSLKNLEARMLLVYGLG